ncbi:uncharacterized protein LOC6621086 [Drosophila sechellia]|uniref:uncharacterized protein LOC6621086 n=1 Tax=Drosophila sechellia TaxID=7238 RepID=UPI0013DDDD9A|nr:uncharacterized protein LOC6621086 [Drosophila sechellia]
MAPPVQKGKLRNHSDKTSTEVNCAINENVRKLVRSLSEPGTSQKKLRQMEDTALKIIANQRRSWDPTTTDMEVKRNLDDLAERFRAEGMASLGDTIKDLAIRYLAMDENQQQFDPNRGWSMLELLFCIADRPVQKIRRNRELMEQLRLSIINSMEAAEREPHLQEQAKLEATRNTSETDEDWPALLAEDFLDPPEDDSSDSLSDWSEESDCNSTTTLTTDENIGVSRSLLEMARVYEQAVMAVVPTGSVNKSYIPTVECVIRSYDFRIMKPMVLSLNNLKGNHLSRSKLLQLAPPQQPRPFTQYWQSDNMDFFRKIHSHWWCQDVHLNALPSSAKPLDNFAVSYVQFLNYNARGLFALPVPKTITESCLLREILFMFVRPASCCFFEFDKATRRITVRDNVSICTVTASTMKNFLLFNVVPALEDMMELRRIIDTHTLHLHGVKTTYTVEFFAYGLRDLVQPICQLLIAYEDRVNKDPAKNTLIRFTIEFRKHFSQLRLLRELAEDVILDKGPAHIRSAYLLSSLYKHTLMHEPHQKLATALLFISLKRYCIIIDGWWRRAALEDHLREFIVEFCYEEDAHIRSHVRKRNVGIEDDLQFVEIFNKLQSCPLYQLLLDHALESGETQDLLCSVNTLSEMLTSNNEIHLQSLHDELFAQLFAQLKVYCGADNTDYEDEPKPDKDYEDLTVCNRQGIRNHQLFAIFTKPLMEQRLERQRERLKSHPFLLANILKRLERSTCLQLKSELPEALREILRRRQWLANEYAIRTYCKEMQVAEKMRFLRHTMLLEKYYLLVPYYDALFVRMEKNNSWALGSVLTSKLCAVLLPHYPQLGHQLHVKLISQINSNSIKVYEALDAIELDFERPVAMNQWYIFTPANMQDYNSVWRLMLKVKWAVWKLENLKFLRRARPNPCAPLDLIGLTIRRLEIVRFWLIFLINKLHAHLMEAVSRQIEHRIGECKSVRDLRNMHDEHLAWLKTHCMLTDEFKSFRVALDQIFHLVYVLDMEWTTCASCMRDHDALCLDFTISDDGIDDGEMQRNSLEYLALNQVAEIELTYIRCHQILADILNTLVHQNDHGFLSALEETINSSVPH